jgi:hypothetical protein
MGNIMGNVVESACGKGGDVDQGDVVLIRCLLPKARVFDDAKHAAPDKNEEDLPTSKQLLAMCSPVFSALLVKSGSDHVLPVDKFCRDDMSLFLRFATLYALPTEQSASGSAVDMTFNRKSIQKVMPIVYFYSCESLWGKLVNWICEKPDLELIVQAERITSTPIKWPVQVLRTIVDETITTPFSTESITVSKGLIGSEPRGTLETGAVVSPNKTELLGQLSSRTMANIIQLLVAEKMNAHVEFIGSTGSKKTPVSAKKTPPGPTSISGGRLRAEST